MNNTLSKWLELIITMTSGERHDAKELAAVMGTSTRNFYYTLEALKTYGFNVIHEGHYYYLDIHSPFFKRISDVIDFSENEALYLYGLLRSVEENNAMAAILKRKLERYYHIEPLTNQRFQRRINNMAIQLEKAIKHKKIVILHDYSSPHSRTVSNRTVEPFLFLGDKTDIRAFEIGSRTNKTYKLSRIGKVEILDSSWFNESGHRLVYSDMFMFSGEDKFHIKLRLNFLARNLMLEEYPQSKQMIRQESDETWIFETDVVSYLGIGRFILGLYNEIEVIEDNGLKQYLNEKIKQMTVKP